MAEIIFVEHPNQASTICALDGPRTSATSADVHCFINSIILLFVIPKSDLATSILRTKAES